MKKGVENKDMLKEKSEYEDVDFKILGKNVKAKYFLVFRLGPNEYNKISSCSTTKKIWDTLVNSHEGTTHVKKFRAFMLSTDYESFKMNLSESLQDMITRFTMIKNELIPLGKGFQLKIKWTNLSELFQGRGT